MFQTLKPVPPDPLLGVTEAFRADSSAAKLDLGVGVYRDATGQTPVMASVRTAEQRMLARQGTKAYVGPAGNRPFAEALTKLTLGDAHPAIAARRVASLQTPGGSGALRLAAELLKLAGYAGAVHVSDPTWANHVPLMSGAGLATLAYPYYDRATGGVLTGRMLEALEALEPGSVVLLHASCHNPTGADLRPADWERLAELLARRRLVPLVDLASTRAWGTVWPRTPTAPGLLARTPARDVNRSELLKELRPLSRARRPSAHRRGKPRARHRRDEPHAGAGATHVFHAAGPRRGRGG